MRYTFLILSLILLSLSLNGMDVESFRLLERDMDARINYPERDPSGRIAAIIKVVNPNTGFSFDTGTAAVVKTAQKKGEIWVYVQPGVKKITISHQSLGILRDYYLPIPVEEAAVYELLLTTGTVHTYVEDEGPRSQYLVITSVPEGADVTLDDVKQGQTPFHKLYKVGDRVQYRVSHPHYRDAVGQIEITAEQPSVNVTLTPAFARLTVNSLPNALITSGGQERGRGSASWNQDEGLCEITVSLPGHRDVKKTVSIRAGSDQTITLNPIPEYGTLLVESTPIGAEIWLDGENLGLTPKALPRILATDHQLDLRFNGSTVYTTSVKVLRGEESKVTAQLQLGPQPRDITVNGITFRMMPVEGGTFRMGVEPNDTVSSNGKLVTLTDYYIGESEVTQELWQAVMGTNPSTFYGAYNLPVEGVSWDDCQIFITKLNQLTGNQFSLPTQAQWEFAARGGNKTNGYHYPGSEIIGDVAWYKNNAPNQLRPVKTKQPNELGLYDMVGNVWERCQDYFEWHASAMVESPERDNSSDSSDTNDTPSDEPLVNPTGPENGYERIALGGSWINDDLGDIIHYIVVFEPDVKGNALGFRLALKP